MAQQANPALTIPASPLGQGLIFRRECQGKPLCKHGTWVIPKRQSWRNLSCYQPRLTAKRPMRAASDCQFGQNQPGNRQPVTIVPKPNKACSGIPKLNPARWMMERFSTLASPRRCTDNFRQIHISKDVFHWSISHDDANLVHDTVDHTLQDGIQI